MMKVYVMDAQDNGLWLELPRYNDELQMLMLNGGVDEATVQVIAVTTNKDYIEPAISDLEQESIEALNHLAQQFYDLHSNDVKDIVTIYLAHGNINYSLEIFYDGDYEIIDDAVDVVSMANQAVEYGIIRVAAHVKPYFDYKKYGQEMANDGWKLVSNGKAIRYGG